MKAGYQMVQILGALALSLLMISCTRAPNTTTNVTIDLPQSMSSKMLGTQSVDTLAHVVVNVTGEGIAVPIVFNWDMKENGGNQALAGPIELTIPVGANRLIQVLAVYSDSTGASIQFYYGDKIQSLAQALETVSLAVTSVSTAGNVFSGRISGRYLTSASGGPTGIVSTNYLPANKPPMTIERNMMYGGWFSVMALYGAKFSYSVLPFGSAPFSLFDGNTVDLSEASFPASATVARLTVPTSQRKNQNNLWAVETPRIFIYGFWGVSAGLNACVYSTPVTAQYAVGNSVNPASQLLAASTAGAAPADFVTNVGLPAMYLQAASGTANGTGACAGLTNYTAGLNITPQMVDNGNDSAAGFMGPFRMTNSQTFALASVNATTYSIAATLLPGASTDISGFNVFKKMGSSDNLPDTLYCSQDSLANLGYQPMVQSSLAGETWTQNLSISAADITDKINLAICPVSRATGAMLPMGVYVKSYQFGGFGGMQPATKLAITNYSIKPGYFYCGNQFMVEAQDASGSLGSISAGVAITLSTANISSIYADPLCNYPVSGTSPTFTTTINSQRTYFYYKVNSQSTATSIVPTGSGLAAGASLSVTSGVDPSTATPPSMIQFLPDMRYNHKLFECIPVGVTAPAPDGTNRILGTVFTSNTTNFTVSGGTGNFYSDSACAGSSIVSWPNSNFASFYPSKTYIPFYVRMTAVGSNFFNINATQGTGSLCNGATNCAGSYSNYPIGTDVNAPATKLNINTGSLGVAGNFATCYALSVEDLDANSWPSVQAGSPTITMAASGASGCATYSDNGCATSTSTFVISPGETRAVVYLKGTGTGSCSITAGQPGLTAANVSVGL